MARMTPEERKHAAELERRRERYAERKAAERAAERKHAAELERRRERYAERKAAERAAERQAAQRARDRAEDRAEARRIAAEQKLTAAERAESARLREAIPHLRPKNLAAIVSRGAERGMSYQDMTARLTRLREGRPTSDDLGVFGRLLEGAAKEPGAYTSEAGNTYQIWTAESLRNAGEGFAIRKGHVAGSAEGMAEKLETLFKIAGDDQTGGIFQIYQHINDRGGFEYYMVVFPGRSTGKRDAVDRPEFLDGDALYEIDIEPGATNFTDGEG